jgi:hypothetical protein
VRHGWLAYPALQNVLLKATVLPFCCPAVSETHDEAGSHLEMSGCAPAVQSALMTGAPLPTDTVAALVGFCKELQGAVIV